MYKKLLTPRSLCMSGIIAALYAALTILLAPISFGVVQCRISEMLTMLPLVMPASIPGLYIGCLIANIAGGNLIDVIFGSLATLMAAIGTYMMRKLTIRKIPFLSILCPIIFNGIIIGIILSLPVNGQTMTLTGTLLTMITIAAEETLPVVAGFVFLLALKKTGFNWSRLS